MSAFYLKMLFSQAPDVFKIFLSLKDNSLFYNGLNVIILF